VEERTLKKQKRNSFKELDKKVGKQFQTETTIIHLRIQEIDRVLSTILNLPQKPVQSYWNLTKKKREYERKLKNKRF
jgi:hypothetical protein